MSRPTDVTFDTKEPKIWEEYSRMAEGIHEIKDSFMIESPDARYDGGEFVFAVSHKVLLEEDHLWNLTPEMLRIARNEIYARHGRRFQDAGLASYFEGCSWYEGVIEPGDFTEDLLNHIERENIKRIQREQERKKEN
ncbi:MAG: YARHG domain-containing protein [Hungatella sp.]|nr:YARHG domain-containing protein [Hungatella sp.]